MSFAGSPDLYWLPPPPADWGAQCAALLADSNASVQNRWDRAKTLAGFRLGFPAVNALDRAMRGFAGDSGHDGLRRRLAVLSSATTAHLAPGLRLGALRRGVALDIYEPDYGQYRQVLVDPHSSFHAFAPSDVLFAFDANTVAAHARGAGTAGEAIAQAGVYLDGLRGLWTAARERTGATVYQQTIMPRLPACFGGNEHRLPASGAAFVARVNVGLRDASDAAGVDLVALDGRVAQDGLGAWFSPASWLSAKQEIALPAAAMYGDLVGRLMGARLGRSAKCCVFDLDNTLWGGVAGDDGADGIVVGQGSAAGEAFLDLQHFALALRERGILLAVCSKNDEANALAPFLSRADMALKREHISCFIANWNDKPSNLRDIARRLNIGLDALVFVDDNPFERELVRQELHGVFVPEVPDDPAGVAHCLADSGCFEAVTLTSEDLGRAGLYAANAGREAFRSARLEDSGDTGLDGYLAELGMVLQWSRFSPGSVPRLTQLINKTNQFNLTTRRLAESDVRALAQTPQVTALQFRLLDRFGDNGIVAVVAGRLGQDGCFAVTDWLMSCRVIGRQVEEATLNVVVNFARQLGASILRAEYAETSRNGMVAGLLGRLGFETKPIPGGHTGELGLAGFEVRDTWIRIEDMSE